MTLIQVNPDGPNEKRRQILAFWEKIGPAIALAVDQSFHKANMRSPTINEVKDRVRKCNNIVAELRNDLKWSTSRIAARLPAILRQRLLGQKDTIDDEVRRDKTKDGVTSAVYGVDPDAMQSKPRVSDAVEINLEKVLPEDQDLSGPAEDAPAVETEDL